MPLATESVNLNLDEEVDYNLISQFMSECKEKRGRTEIEKISGNKLRIKCLYEKPTGETVVTTSGNMKFITKEYRFIGDPEQDLVTLVKMIEEYKDLKNKTWSPAIHSGGRIEKGDKTELIYHLVGAKEIKEETPD